MNDTVLIVAVVAVLGAGLAVVVLTQKKQPEFFADASRKNKEMPIEDSLFFKEIGQVGATKFFNDIAMKQRHELERKKEFEDGIATSDMGMKRFLETQIVVNPVSGQLTPLRKEISL